MAYNIFERWPFTSFQNLNLDWILRNMKEAVDKANEASDTVGQFDSRISANTQNIADLTEDVNNKPEPMMIDVNTNLQVLYKTLPITGGEIYNAMVIKRYLPFVRYRDEIYMVDSVFTDSAQRDVIRFALLYAPDLGDPYIKRLDILFTSNTAAYSIKTISGGESADDVLEIRVTANGSTYQTNTAYSQISAAAARGYFIYLRLVDVSDNTLFTTGLMSFGNNAYKFINPDSFLTGGQMYAIVINSNNVVYQLIGPQYLTVDAFAEYLPRLLPVVSSADNGKSLRVVEGEWEPAEDPYVTPEQFGAVGDGVADDTAAIQAAVNSGKNVAFGYQKTYKCGTINVNRNIEIDCRWSSFICTAETLFNCSGSVTESVAGADYVANTKYQLGNYTGMAMLKSTENTITERDYYRAGFVAFFENGVCSDNIASSFGNVTVDKINPITVKIRNIDGVNFDAVRDYNTAIICEYGRDCEFSDIFVNDGLMYSVVELKKSRGCVVRNVNGYVNYSGTIPNYYPIGIEDSSFCLITGCSLRSEWWHCCDTGGWYYCLNNTIENCDFSVNGWAASFADHPNGIGTRIINSKLDNVQIGGNGYVDGCKIRRSKISETNLGCALILHPNNISGMNHFTVKNTRFIADNSGSIMTASNYGINLRGSTGNIPVSHVVDSITIENVHTEGEHNSANFSMLNIAAPTVEGTTLLITGPVVIDDANGLFISDSANVFKRDNERDCFLVIRNCHVTNNRFVSIGLDGNSQFPRKVVISDCLLGTIRGKYTRLCLDNVDTGAGSNLMIANSVSGSYLTGNNVGYINDDSLDNFAFGQITQMRSENGNQWYSNVYVTSGVVEKISKVAAAN